MQTLIVRRGQVRDGKVDDKLTGSGEEVYRFQQTFGQQAPVTFDLTPADFDANGTLWLSLEIESVSEPGSVMPLWSITDFGADLEGRVIEEDQGSSVKERG